MNVHPVDSKQKMLEVGDILLVAAHEAAKASQKFKKASKKTGISEERLMYTALMELYKKPNTIRIRSGNTLFSILPMEKRIGALIDFNADTSQNHVNNLVDFLKSALKMGFNQIFSFLDAEEVKAFKSAIKKSNIPGIEFRFNSSNNSFVVKINDLRGE